MLKMDEELDVIIVGAGIAGLTAARTLLQKHPNIKLAVLEGKNRVGGRTLTIPIKTANHTTDQFDLGGQWIGRTQTEALALLKELGMELYEQYEKGKKMAQIGSTDVRSYSASLPIFAAGTFTLREVVDFVISIFRLNRMTSKVNVLDAFSWEGAAKADTHTVAAYAAEATSTRTARDALDIGMRAVYGVEAKRMSLLFHLLYCKSGGSFIDLIEATGNGAQAFRIKGGSQQISLKMASELGDRVRLESEVREVDTSEGGTTTLTLRNGQRLVAKRVILCIPPSQCRTLSFSPPLPYLKHRLFVNATPRNAFMTAMNSRGPMSIRKRRNRDKPRKYRGHLVKFVITYATSFWRDDGKSGEIISSGRTTIPGEILPIICTYDATTSNGSPAIVGFIHAELHDWTKQDRCNAVVKDLVRFLGEKALREFIAYEEKNWNEEPLNGGCPVDYLTPGNMDAFAVIRDTHYGVHFGGTETALEWMGYMNGAVESGRRTANEVLYALGEKQRVDHKYLKGSELSVEYHQPIPPSDHYSSSRSPWFRRLFFGVSVVVGIYAVSKKYELSYPARVFHPVEKVVYKLWTGNNWP